MIFNQYIQHSNWKDEHNWFKWPYKRGKIIKNYTGWDFRMWLMAVLTGFSNSKMYVRLAGTKNQWPNNEVTIFTRRL